MAAGTGMKQRFKLTLEYDGGPFHGWQRQDNRPSVQQCLEDAVGRLCGAAAPVQGAGRTDAGVHALGQVAHVDLARPIAGDKLRDALNALVRPHPISILAAEAVDDGFHARFSANERRYLYRLLDRRPPPGLDRGRVWWTRVPLDAAAMHAAARVLIGRHDFSSFRARGCQADSPVRTLDRFDIARVGDEIHVTARARSFLHHQVRNLVGSLAEVGRGRWTAADIAGILRAADRTAAGPTAPPEGLYLTGVGYPDDRAAAPPA